MIHSVVHPETSLYCRIRYFEQLGIIYGAAGIYFCLPVHAAPISRWHYFGLLGFVISGCRFSRLTGVALFHSKSSLQVDQNGAAAFSQALLASLLTPCSCCYDIKVALLLPAGVCYYWLPFSREDALIHPEASLYCHIRYSKRLPVLFRFD